MAADLTALLPAAAATPGPSPTPNVCDQISPVDSASFLGRVACDVAPGVGQAISGAAGQIGQAAAGVAEADLNAWIANGAAWMVRTVTQVLVGNSSTPNLDPTQAASFAFVYGRVVGVALSLSVLLALVGIIEATLTQRPGGLRRVITGIAVSGIGLGAVPVCTAVLVRITDDLSGYVAGQSQSVAAGLGLVVATLGQQPGGDAVFALVGVGLIVGGALLWLELVVRASLIYVFLGIAPLACAAVQWPRLEGVLRQVLFGGLALILSKLVVVIVLAIGFAVLPAGGGLLGMLGGMFIIGIAGLMPFATARVLPVAAEEMALSHQGRMRGWMVSTIGSSTRLISSVSAVSTASQLRPIRPMSESGSRSWSPGSGGTRNGPGPRRSDSRLPTSDSGPTPPRPVGPPPRRRTRSTEQQAK